MTANCDPQKGCIPVVEMQGRVENLAQRTDAHGHDIQLLFAKIDQLVDAIGNLWKTALLFVLSSIIAPLGIAFVVWVFNNFHHK